MVFLFIKITFQNKQELTSGIILKKVHLNLLKIKLHETAYTNCRLLHSP